MDVVQESCFPRGIPAQFDVLEVLAIVEKRIQAVERFGRIGIAVGEPADQVPVFVQVPAQRHAPALVGYCHRGRAGGEGEIEVAGPRAGQHVDVDVVGDVHETAHEHQVAALHALTPVEVCQTGTLVAEWRQV